MDRTERILGMLKIIAAIAGIIATLFVFYQFFAPRYCLDVDGDGIHDEYDDCYNPGCTIVDAYGCPRDSDTDGIPDFEDRCEIEITIYFVNYNAEGNDNINLNGEWVEIHNTGDQDIDMTGWKLLDESRHCFDFPYGFELKAGQSVKIFTGSGENTAFELYWGCSKPVWTNDGDCAFLVDNQGNEVDIRCW